MAKFELNLNDLVLCLKGTTTNAECRLVHLSIF